MAETPSPSTRTPDWIRYEEELPPRAIQSALLTKVRLESRDRATQLAALEWIREDIELYGTEAARYTVVPLLTELVSRRYRVLELPPAYLVDGQVRIAGLELLARIGGPDAVQQLTESLRLDPDTTVRGYAATLLSTHPDADPDHVMEDLTVALYRAHRSSVMRESQVFVLLHALEATLPGAWIFNGTALARELVDVVTGSYSLAVRSKAARLLERLVER